MNSVNRKESLDGVRGISIYFVIFCHYFAHAGTQGIGTKITFLSIDIQAALLQLGSVGVTFFFVLSAYLLTKNFLDQKYRNIPDYVRKRFYRIYPSFIFFTSIYLICYKLLGKYPYASQLDNKYFVICIAFLQPLFIGTSYHAVDILPGTWSLYPEIYFYVFYLPS